METKGLFKRIAAISMAVLTVATSSGADFTLLRANAADIEKTQMTDASTNAPDSETSEQSDEAGAPEASSDTASSDTATDSGSAGSDQPASTKLSFGSKTLSKAVQEAGFSIDPSTGEVVAGAIRYHGSLLELGKDYTATAEKVDEKAEDGKTKYVYNVVVEGTGNYEGKAEKDGVEVVVNDKVAKKIKRKVNSENNLDEASVLEENSTNTVKAGKWTVTFKDNIVVEQGNKRYIGYIKKFANQKITPEVTVKYGERDLKKDTNYLLDYGNNNTYSTPSNLTGTITINPVDSNDINDEGCKISFYIRRSITAVENSVYIYTDENDKHKVNFDSNGIGTAAGEFEYNGSKVEPVVEAIERTVDGAPLYTTITSANKGQWDATGNDQVSQQKQKAKIVATIPTVSDYAGEQITIYFTITNRSLKNHQSDKSGSGINVTVSGDNSRLVYTGQPIEPGFKVVDNDIKDSSKKPKELTPGTDYEVTYSNNTNAGTATATIKGIGNYKDTITKTFKINPKQAITDKGAIDNEIKIDGLDNKGRLTAVYTGDEVIPGPTITYSPAGVKDEDGNQLVITLKKGTDYTIEKTGSGAGRTNVTESNATTYPKVKITFKGNYSGELEKEYTITKGEFAAGTKLLDSDEKVLATVSSDSKNDDGPYVVGKDGSIVLQYDPTGDKPVFLLKVNNLTINETNGFTLSEPESVDATTYSKQTTQKQWPSITSSTATDNWRWKVTLTGKGNYEGSKIDVIFAVEPLNLSTNTHVQKDKITATISDGVPTVVIPYKSVRGTTKDITAKETVNKQEIENFTVSPEKFTGAAAQETITVKGQGNYTGELSLTASNGSDLANSSTRPDADVRITYYDPYTGENINSEGMRYYGKGVMPHIEIAKKVTEGGTTYYKRLLERSDFTVEADPIKEDKKIPDSSKGEKTRHYIVITGVDSGGNLYGKTTNAYYDTYAYKIGNGTDLDKAFAIDTSRVDNIASAKADQITVSFNPARKIVVKEDNQSNSTGGNNGSGATIKYTTESTDYFGDKKTRITVDNKTVSGAAINWLLPERSDITLKPDEDYTIDRTSTSGNGLKGGKVRISGHGNFSDSAIIDIGIPSINESDFYLEYNGQRVEKNSKGQYDLGEIYFTTQPQFPEVDLIQSSTKTTLIGRYKSDTNPYDYTVQYSYKGTTYDPGVTQTDGNDNKNRFKNTGSYTMTLDAGAGARENSTTSGSAAGTSNGYTGAYKGKLTVVYQIVPGADIEARFSPQTIYYNGNKTPQPVFNYTTSGGSGSVLRVYADGKLLKYGDGEDGDYTVAESPDSDYFKYPGQKEVTIEGKGEYDGITISSGSYGTQGYFYVNADLSRLADTELYTVKLAGKSNFALSDLETLYYDGSVLRLKDGTAVNAGSISVETKGNHTLEQGTEYTITGLDINRATNNAKIVFQGIGNYCSGKYEISTTVKINRSNFKWLTSDSDTLTLPYTGRGYTLGQGDLTFGNNASNGSAALDYSNDTVKVTSQSVSETLEADKFNNIKQNSTPTFIKPGIYTISIKGPDSTGESTLRLRILYDLSNAIITYENATLDGRTFIYNGRDQITQDQINVSVNRGSQALSNGTDFGITRTSTAGNLTDAGDVTVEVIPKDGVSSYEFDNRSGSTTTTAVYTINRLNLSDNLTVELKGDYRVTESANGSRKSGITFTGNMYTLTNDDLTVTYKESGGQTLTLTLGTDYNISYLGDQKSAGDQPFIVSGTGNYQGEFQGASFYINQFDLTNATVSIDNQYYAGGTEVRPSEIKVRVGSSTMKLESPSDFTAVKASGYENKSVGKDNRVVVTGHGNFTGSKVVTFEIVKLDLRSLRVEDINLPIERDYTGRTIDIAGSIVITLPGNADRQLVYGTDYTIQYEDASGEAVVPKNAGNYTVTIVPGENSNLISPTSASKDVSDGLIIKPINLRDHIDEFAVSNAEWTGSEVEPDVTRNGVVLEKGANKDITVTYENNVNSCGTLEDMKKFYSSTFSSDNLPVAHIRSGNGNYSGSIDLTFTIGHPFSDVNASQNGTIQYDGEDHTPQKGVNFTVTYRGKSVDENAYDVTGTTGSDFTNAGSKTVTLTADRTKGGFYGTKTFTYRIAPNSTAVWGFSLDLDTNQSGDYVTEYPGGPVTPGVYVYILDTDGNETTMSESEYTVSYSNNTKAGTAYVTVTPKNYSSRRCANENPQPFTILGADITGTQFRVRFADTLTRRRYTGAAITPAVRVTLVGRTSTANLTQGTDFTVTYRNNTNAGKATATVTGIGSYSGTKELNFDIYASLADGTSVIMVPKQMYTAEPITSLDDVTVIAGGNTLTAGSDYSVEITSSDGYRTRGQATFTGKGSYYEGSRTVNFTIGNDSSMYSIVGVPATFTYDRMAHKPVPVVTDRKGEVYPTDSVTYNSASDGEKCIAAGNVVMSVTITSHGQTIVIPYNYVILPRNISNAVISDIKDANFNGLAKTPDITVTDGTHELKGTTGTAGPDTDYVISYSNNLRPGTATVTITGVNNYTGTQNKYFTISMKQAPQIIVTAMPSGRVKVTWQKVSGIDGYRLYYSSNRDAQKQYNIAGSKSSVYLTGLKRGRTYTIGVQSFITQNGQTGYSDANVQTIATSSKRPVISSAKSTAKGKIKITWKKVSNASGYMVYRKKGNGSWKRVKTTAASKRSFTNSGLSSGSKYTYKVIAYTQNGVKRTFTRYSKGRTVTAR